MKFFLIQIRKVIVIGCCLLFINKLSGQTLPPTNDLKQIITPSPTASSLGQFGNTPVGIYTGTAQINIPIYEINEGALKLPISLNYNSGGIKVADLGSWVGLGFSLNAGGAITRTAYGLPDETLINAPYTVPTTASFGQLKSELMGTVDYQPDVFYFNFNGKSGKFILSQTSNIEVSPHQNLKIQAYDVNGNPVNPPFKQISTLLFRVTDENGIVYEFKDYETNRTINYNPDKTDDPFFNMPGVRLPSISAWYLTDMFSPTGDTIRFTYGNYTLSYDLPSSEQQYVFLSGQQISDLDQPIQEQFVKNVVRAQNQNKRLQKISFSNGSVLFGANNARFDLIGDTLLNQISIVRKDGSPVKGYSFQYKYAANGSSLVDVTSLGGTTVNNYYSAYVANAGSNSSILRAMLTGISELDNNYTVTGKNYSFSYNLSQGGLPDRFSKKRDYWGYYNGNSDQETSFLNYLLVGPDYDPNSYLITGKEPDSNYCRQNSLTKITYPTGGYSQMNYELHNAYVGKGVLPREVKSQTFSMPIDFLSYGTGSYTTSTGYTDTLINGVHCYYKLLKFNSLPSGANANLTISNILYQGVGKPVLKFDIYDSANNPFLLMWDVENSTGTTTTYVDINSTTRRYQYALNYYFPNGTYKVIFTPIGSYIGNSNYLSTYLAQPLCTLSGWSNIVVHTDTVDLSRNIGGNRIRSTIDYDPVTNRYLQKNYSYTLAGSGFSSGELVSGVNYVYPQGECVMVTDGKSGGTSENIIAYYHYMLINGESNYSLSTTQGSNVGYSTVTVTEVDPVTGTPNGKSDYYYSSPKTYPDYYGTRQGPINLFPYALADDRDWQRGHLLKQIDYQYSGGLFTPIKVETNAYGTPIYVDTLSGYVARYIIQMFPSVADTGNTVNGPGGSAANPEEFSGLPYNLTSGYVPLLSKSTTQIVNTDSLTTTENYTYGDAPGNLLPTVTASTDSKGITTTTHLKYPFDYSIASPVTSQAKGILDLQQRHIISPVVEKYSQKASSTGTDIGAIAGIYTTFKPLQPLADTVFRLETTAPIPGYAPIIITDGSTTINSHYTPLVSFGAYDSKGNLLQQNKVNDLSMAYLWDYQSKYPIAEIKNAQSTDVAYTSFEADGTGNWTISALKLGTTGGLTGNNFDTLATGVTISKSGLSTSRSYLVSYWSKNGALTISGTTATTGLVKKGWTFYQHTLPAASTSVSITGSGIILDELRLYPADAQMNTYTYSPLVGMTSNCSANNLATYYEYDGVGRLLRIRDVDGNIVKQYDYQYQLPYTQAH